MTNETEVRTRDRKYAESICKAFCVLPAEKREYLLGVADGMAAMANMQAAQSPADRPNSAARRLEEFL